MVLCERFQNLWIMMEFESEGDVIEKGRRFHGKESSALVAIRELG